MTPTLFDRTELPWGAAGLLAGALAASYAGAWALRSAGRGRPGAIVTATPGLAFAVAAAIVQPALAVPVVLATALAHLCLGGGIVLLTSVGGVSPAGGDGPRAPGVGLLLPAALGVLLIGLAGRAGIVEAVAAAVLAVALLPGLVGPRTVAVPGSGGDGRVLALAGLAVLGVGAFAGVSGVVAARAINPATSPAVLTVCFLGPVSVFPWVGVLGSEAESGRAGGWSAMLRVVGAAGVTVLAGLPLAALAGWTRWTVDRYVAGPNVVTDAADATAWPGLAFPVTAWRVDAVLLVVLAVALTPLAGGRWRAGRLEGILLVLGYAAYLALSAALDRG